MNDLFFTTLLACALSLLGAWFIRDAVLRFKAGEYYWFGFEVCGAFYMVAHIFRLVLFM